MSRFAKFALPAIILGLCITPQLARGQDQAKAPEAGAVKVVEDETSFTLSNGIVKARVLKRSGDLVSLEFKGTETLTDQSGHAGGYWSHDASSPKQLHRITMDPAGNGGERGEVSVKGISEGRRLGRPAGLAPGAEGDFPADIEIRYSLGRGDSGVYTYCTLEHLPEYPAGAIGEARYCAKLAAMFDWMSVDPKRNKYYPRELPGEDKYVYTAVQSENRAYGWSSTTKDIGWWIVNPTIEYLSGGPTKVEFLCHRDTTPVQAPCVLNYWRSSHYGGAVLPVTAGEKWAKVVGPFFIYVNSGGDSQTLWRDALAQADREAKKWPYDWVNGVDYPHRDQRSTVSGTFDLKDPLMPGGASFAGQLTVGLAVPTYSYTPAPPAPARGGARRGATTAPAQVALGGGGGRGPTTAPAAAAAPATPPSPREVTWQTDGKHYQFWTHNDKHNGSFNIPNVRPGKYTLYAYADGILGEFSKADITIEPGGKPVDLGQVAWSPVRRGKQLWEIGTPNRTATEFTHGDRYFDADSQLQYPRLFPNDVNFVIGKSDISNDWYYEHIPHNEDPNARVVPFSGVRGNGRATPYAITFEMADASRGRATLRIAFCTAGVPVLDLSVNGKSAGPLDLPRTGDSTITRHNIQGIWFERELAFDASMMKKGTNVLTITVPPGPINSGVIYDYLRLELDESAAAPTASVE